MARRVYSAIPKFNRVEAALREATNGFRTTLGEIDAALAGPRSETEKALLRSIRDQTARVHQDARTVLGRLYDEVES